MRVLDGSEDRRNDAIGPVLSAVLAITVVTYAYIVWKNFGRPLWLDEIFTLSFTSKDFTNLMEQLAEDVHPPLYYLVISALRRVFEAESPIVIGRGMNFVFLGAVLLALLLVWRKLGRRDAILLAAILPCSGGFAYYLLEIRAYFGLIAIGLLMTVALQFGKAKWELLIGAIAAVVLSQLHFFGSASALSTVTWFAFRAHLDGERVRRISLALTGSLIFLLLSIWFALTTNMVSRINENGFWIITSWQTYWSFMADLARFPAIVLGMSVALLLVSRKILSRPVIDAAVPALLVVFGTLAISMWQPIVTPRNLLVILPNIALIGVIGLRTVEFQWPLEAGFAIVALAHIAMLPPYSDSLKNADWVVSRALPAECVGVPMVGADQSEVRWGHAAAAFDKPRRPVVSADEFLSAYRRDPDQFRACPIIAAEFHRFDWLKPVEARLGAENIRFERLAAPGRHAKVEYGYVLRLTPDIP